MSWKEIEVLWGCNIAHMRAGRYEVTHLQRWELADVDLRGEKRLKQQYAWNPISPKTHIPCWWREQHQILEGVSKCLGHEHPMLVGGGHWKVAPLKYMPGYYTCMCVYGQRERKIKVYIALRRDGAMHFKRLQEVWVYYDDEGRRVEYIKGQWMERRRYWSWSTRGPTP